MHYSWDYAQQVHFPHHVQQVEPIYFKTPRKCYVFGMCSEGTGKQTFYLVDEEETQGKGANSVVSMVHHYLMYYGHGETNGKFHFDNCSGQNKNNVVLWYALWRVLTESCDSVPITVNLLEKNTIISTSTMPNTLTPNGLDAARQWYLYEQIREFCYNDANKDVICPKTTIAKTEVDLTSDVDTNNHKCPSRKQYLLN
ncbi:unnamed protein product [Mytilus coruscus]|uniref:Uncharacterized protein n=1 Tax=Mytilus coruscus TaxID=42192 RepID=A0A6J8C927_MYTCO|nr:unnamed protein product [Mytilus coruscus]